jgi:hypothetical protein
MKIKIEKLKKIIEKDYFVANSVTAILNGNRKPNADLRYKYEKEHGIPFDGWGKKIKEHIEEACPCCGTILKKKEKD